jgi:putative transposase
MGLRSKQRRKFKATTNSKHNLPVAPNLLEQNFDIDEPGLVWGSDLTYVGTDEGRLYLAGILDFCSKEVVGYALGSSMTKNHPYTQPGYAGTSHRIVFKCEPEVLFPFP